MAIDIDFQWQRDEKGYVLVTGYGSTAFELVGGELGNPKPMLERRIVRRGGRLVPCRDLSPDLYLTFTRFAVREEQLLQFVNQYGPLTQAGNSMRGESAQDDLDVAAQMAMLLLQAKNKENILALEIKAIDLELIIGADSGTGQPKITYRIDELQDALWIQCAEAVSSGTNIRLCDLCGGLFKAGPGTGRREDAKYCSDAHRIAFNSEKRVKRATPVTEPDSL